MTTQSAIVAVNVALDDACFAIFKHGVKHAKSQMGLHSIVREGLAGITQGGDAFKAAARELRVSYELGNLVGAGHAENKDAALEIRAKNAKVETRDALSYQCQRSAASNFSHALRYAGFVSLDKRAGNARKPGGSQNQTTTASAPAAPIKSDAPVSVPTFTKDYDAKGDMLAIAARLAKGIASKPKAFNGGLHAIASEFITAMAAFQKAQAAKEQN